MLNQVVSVRPEFGVNYEVGDIGFTFTDRSIISCGIAWFTKWDKGINPDVPNIPVSHVFIVSDENECIEATIPKVRRHALSEYFNAKNTHIVFRKPVGLNPEIGQRIVDVAASRLGCSYGYSLIVGHALANSLVGKLLSTISSGWTTKALERLFENKHQFICSELGSTALNEQPEYRDKGILAQPPYTINPMRLFGDRVIFEPWATKLKGSKVRGPVQQLKTPADAAKS